MWESFLVLFERLLGDLDVRAVLHIGDLLTLTDFFVI